MKYLIDRKCGNRIYRTYDGKAEYLDPFQNEWVPSEISPESSDLDAHDAEMYERALAIAHRVHGGQKDKGGSDYINHPVTVSTFTEGNMTSVISAVLHDVVEDTETSLEDLRKSGFDDAVIACVDCVTRREGERRKDYLRRLSANPDAIRVKLADLRHNSDLSRIPSVTQRDLDRVANYQRETAYLRNILDEVER